MVDQNAKASGELRAPYQWRVWKDPVKTCFAKKLGVSFRMDLREPFKTTYHKYIC